MSNVDAFPLSWPDGWERTPDEERIDFLQGGRQSQNWTEQTERLFNELRLFKATNVVLSTNQPLKKDGRPYASRSKDVWDPGVAVYFDLDGKSLVIAQDRYRMVVDNIRSICIGIEGLRQMHRHGGGQMAERAFRGFAALPEPATEKWWDILGVSRDCTFEEAHSAHVDMIFKHHPDVGGDPYHMAKINAAWEEARMEIVRRDKND